MSLPAKKGGALIGAMAISTVVATGGLNGAPVANATCFSAFGLNNGNGCTSNLTTIAIAIGDGAKADASTGLFASAIAVGDGANAGTLFSAFTQAIAFGAYSTASALLGVLSFAFQGGAGNAATIGGPNLVISLPWGNGAANSSASGLGNLVVQYGPGNASGLGILNLSLGVSPNGNGQQATASGILGGMAINLFNNSYNAAQGVLSLALRLFNIQLWPFPLFVEALKVVQNAVGAILSFFGLTSSPADSTIVPQELREGSDLEPLSDVESRVKALSPRERAVVDAATLVDVTVTDAPAETLSTELTTPENLKAAVELVAPEALDVTVAETPALDEGTEVDGTEVDGAPAAQDADLGAEVTKSRGEEIKRNLREARDHARSVRATAESTDTDTDTDRRTRKSNPRQDAGNAPSAGEARDAGDTGSSARSRVAARSVA